MKEPKKKSRQTRTLSDCVTQAGLRAFYFVHNYFSMVSMNTLYLSGLRLPLCSIVSFGLTYLLARLLFRFISFAHKYYFPKLDANAYMRDAGYPAYRQAASVPDLLLLLFRAHLFFICLNETKFANANK